MTKLSKVLKFCNMRFAFTWQQFLKEHKCEYPCTETNYLGMLVNAQYIQRVGRGKYQVNQNPPMTITFGQLKQESKNGTY